MLRKKVFPHTILDDKNFLLPHKIRNFPKEQIQFIVVIDASPRARYDKVYGPDGGIGNDLARV
jgi:hypothetical protein